MTFDLWLVVVIALVALYAGVLNGLAVSAWYNNPTEKR